MPSVIWIALALLITDDYHWTNLFLVEKFFGPDDSMTAGRLWFIEVLVWILVALTLVVWLPSADRLERRRPFAFAAAFLVFGLAVRYDVLGLHFGREAWFTILAFWFFAVGWAAAKSSTVWQRLLVTLVLIVSVHGYFDSTHRETLVLAGFLLLIWLPAIRCPAWCTVVAGHGRGGVAVHVSDALPDLSVVRRPSPARCRRGDRRRRLDHPTGQRDPHADPRAGGTQRYCGVGSRSAISPSCTRVAAMTPSARTRLPVTTPRPRAAAGDLVSSRFHSFARTG